MSRNNSVPAHTTYSFSVPSAKLKRYLRGRTHHSFDSSPSSRPPLLLSPVSPSPSRTHGSLLSAKPCTKEREGGTDQTIVAGSRHHHFRPVVSLFFWVSGGNLVQAHGLQDLINSSQLVSLDLRRHRLLQRLTHRSQSPNSV